jgi:hypothetical protein
LGEILLMKALSFRQPWAELILQGRKTIDLRTWPTHYRGPLAIHASKTVEAKICAVYDIDPASLVRGALVGTVEVVEMAPLDDETWEALRHQHLKPGPFPGDLLGWRLTNPQRLAQPIPMRGRLGLFNIPDELLERPLAVSRQPSAESKQSLPIENRKLALSGSSLSQAEGSKIVNRPAYRVDPQPTYDPDKPFELHVVPQANGSNDYGLALYQWPITATPQGDSRSGGTGEQPRQPERLADLAGDSLRAVADHVLAALRQSGYKATDLSATRRKPFYLDEETGLRLGLLFLAIKPLSRLDRVEAISQALRVMPSEEAYYWFSKCTAGVNAVNAQRALRILLAGE